MVDNIEIICSTLFANLDPRLLYMLQVIKRKKDNINETDSLILGDRNALVLNVVITSDPFGAKLIDSLKLQAKMYRARIYMKVGSIDPYKAATRTLARSAKKISEGCTEIKGDYVSVCGSMKTRWWVIDIDKESDKDVCRLTNVVLKVPTVSGEHWIVEPFDFRGTPQKDVLLWADL